MTYVVLVRDSKVSKSQTFKSCASYDFSYIKGKCREFFRPSCGKKKIQLGRGTNTFRENFISNFLFKNFILNSYEKKNQ